METDVLQKSMFFSDINRKANGNRNAEHLQENAVNMKYEQN